MTAPLAVHMSMCHKATDLRCNDRIYLILFCRSSENDREKKLWTLVDICQSYHKNKSGPDSTKTTEYCIWLPTQYSSDKTDQCFAHWYKNKRKNCYLYKKVMLLESECWDIRVPTLLLIKKFQDIPGSSNIFSESFRNLLTFKQKKTNSYISATQCWFKMPSKSINYTEFSFSRTAQNLEL